MTTQTDVLNRYLFDDLHVRGELVQLSKTYQDIIAKHQYPPAVKKLLGELVTATCLLTATLKFEGEIAIQLQGDGPVSYLAVNGSDQQDMRAIARVNDESTQAEGLLALLGKANMIITIRPKNSEAYQGVVALDKETLAECFTHYFEVSEQIPTKLWLFHNEEEHKVAGCLVQLLPDGDDTQKQQDDFEHLCQLTHTIKADELFNLDAQTILYRLYHQEKVRLFDPQPVKFKCSCSEEKCMTAISQFNIEELKGIIAEVGHVSMTCDYCYTTYAFDEEKLAPFINDKQH